MIEKILQHSDTIKMRYDFLYIDREECSEQLSSQIKNAPNFDNYGKRLLCIQIGAEREDDKMMVEVYHWDIPCFGISANRIDTAVVDKDKVHLFTFDSCLGLLDRYQYLSYVYGLCFRYWYKSSNTDNEKQYAMCREGEHYTLDVIKWFDDNLTLQDKIDKMLEWLKENGVKQNTANGYKAGDICFYDHELDKLAIVPFSEWTIKLYPSSKYTPIGVVVIPSSHNVYGTFQCAVMSLKEMNYSMPDEGGIHQQCQRVVWGEHGPESSLPHLNVTIISGTNISPSDKANGLSSYSYLPSDNFDNSQCPTDPLAKYAPFVYSVSVSPSPYLEDDSRNPVYYQTENPSSILNCLADFDGFEKTNVICKLATAQPNWKTDDTITNSGNEGHFPVACCCWRYHTKGTKQGDWYLPSCGELGYMIVRWKTINVTIKSLIDAYGEDVGVSVAEYGDYWSVSESSNNESRIIRTSNGYVGSSDKYNPKFIRAFLRV